MYNYDDGNYLSDKCNLLGEMNVKPPVISPCAAGTRKVSNKIKFH